MKRPTRVPRYRTSVNGNPLVALQRRWAEDQPMTQAARDKLTTTLYSAMEAFAKGRATPSEFNDLVDTVHICKTLSMSTDLQIEPDAQQAIPQAYAALHRAAERRDAGHTLGIDGPGMQALRMCVQTYADSLTVLTNLQVRQVMTETIRRVRADATKRPDDVVVL